MTLHQEIKFQKQRLRKEKAALRAALTKEERLHKSREIHKQLTKLPEFQEAGQIMLYLDFRQEVETTGLAEQILAEGKELIIPCCRDRNIIPCRINNLAEDIAPGKLGIREPKEKFVRGIDPRKIDLVVVPGVVFDLQGNRIGYGAGYYDRFLPRLRDDVPVIGVAFSCQLVKKILTESYDRKMSLLVTENSVIYLK